MRNPVLRHCNRLQALGVHPLVADSKHHPKTATQLNSPRIERIRLPVGSNNHVGEQVTAFFEIVVKERFEKHLVDRITSKVVGQADLMSSVLSFRC